MKILSGLLVTTLVLIVASCPIRYVLAEEGVEDAEAATHGDEAAMYQIVDTYEFPGFKIVQYDLAVLSHFSYLLISEGEVLVIDPGRDAQVYLDAAKEVGAKIVGVWLSHSHADFVAGHIEVASKLNVPIYISAKANAGYQHLALNEGDTLTVGKAKLSFLDTPGHTLDSMCALVANTDAPDKPLAMLTGDTLFIGSVGRPDLMGGSISAAALASMMFDTWTKKLSPLPDEVLILPAHGAGSLCGAHLSDEPVSTLGQQRTSNPYLAHKSRGDFVAAVLDGLPEAPQYFKHNAAINQAGPPLVQWKTPELPKIAPDISLTDPSRFEVIDIRDAKAFAAGHIPNSINIALRGRFETWTGVMVPWEAEKVLIGTEPELREAIDRLHRVGYSVRVLTVEDWQQAQLPLVPANMVAPKDLHQKMLSTDSPLIVDVRLPKEWMAARIGTIINMPLNHLAESAAKLDPNQEIVTVCNSAYRSMMAVGILQRAGFKKVSNLEGGGEAWIEAGLPVFYAKSPGAEAAVPRREIQLAERISAAELKRIMMDLPGTIEIVDIRPASHFADYNLPGSRNVDIVDLIQNPSYLTGVGSLVIVDRDGSLSMMAAGILSQKTPRRIKALFGGLDAYWSESDFGAGAQPIMGPQPPIGTLPAAAPTGASSSVPSQPPVKKRKKAGC